ncbi:MAG: ComEC/Rec2 family competence protein [Candidatus Paceibacterota bacterium]
MIELLTIALVAGALLYRSLHIGLIAIGMISALTSAFFFIYFLGRKSFVVGILCGIALFAGAVRVSFDTSYVPQSFYNRKIVSGVVQTVDRRLDKTLVTIKDDQYKKVLQATSRSKTSVLPGDVVQVRGQVEKPKDFLTDSGRMFEYKNYLQSKGIVGLVSNSSIKSVSLGGFSVTRVATMLRFHIATIFSQYVSFPTDGLVSGMLVGYQGSIPEDIQDLFRTTGVLHVLVLSGENITLLAGFLTTILSIIPFKIKSFFIALAIILIVLISGSGVAAVRAGIMGCIALSAGLLRRTYVPLRALTISVAAFFFYSPATLFVDPGFHLSALATIFMIVVLSKMQHVFTALPIKENIREMIILVIGVPLFMLPYTMYFSGLEPLSSPFANIMMTFAVPIIMLLGAVIFIFSWIHPLAYLIGIILSFIGSTVIHILKILNTMPQLNTPPIAWWGVVGAYALFFIVVQRKEIQLHSSSFVQESQ